ncbi:hypothetical protein [Devosia sp. FJ2-5-3]|uniref:site-specific integrase n=1 Tax=Devosia sp. FJ2-5-3 TaxID=2976680 RepID=UPI0023D8BC03|nr:hypothetical protein [Devosia sp. FJ2-5-3]WEJ56768.1 hypothetical protein N0P34_11085 [Devosia sp. FJ2-5-3]
MSSSDIKLEQEWAAQTAQNHAARTMSIYRRVAKHFITWLADQDLTLLDVDRETLLTYLAETRPRHTDTLRGIGKLFDFLVSRGVVSTNPAKGVSWKIPPIQRKPLDEHLVHSFLDRLAPPRNGEAYSEVRVMTWAIVELVYSSGVSSNELIDLKTSDLDFTALTLKVGTRQVPITPKAGDALAYWIRVRNEKYAVPAKFLFHSHTDPGGPLRQLPGKFLLQRFRGSGPLFTLSELRAAYICHSASRGLSVINLARMVGMGARQVENLLEMHRIQT